jgi:hypothetical protein
MGQHLLTFERRETQSPRAQIRFVSDNVASTTRRDEGEPPATPHPPLSVWLSTEIGFHNVSQRVVHSSTARAERSVVVREMLFDGAVMRAHAGHDSPRSQTGARPFIAHRVGRDHAVAMHRSFRGKQDQCIKPVMRPADPPT